MKKLILVAMMAIFSSSMSAQLSNNTLKFMGIEIKGDEDVFYNKLEQKGFTRTSNGLFTGQFLSKEATLVVAPTPITKQIYQVVVALGKESNYTSYKLKMEELQELFTSKYGRPMVEKYFLSPYEDGDGYEMSALANDKLVWMLKWGEDIVILLSYDLGILIYYINPELKSLGEEESKSINLSQI